MGPACLHFLENIFSLIEIYLSELIMGLTYFISDVHLGEQPESIEKTRIKQFIRFLREVEESASSVFFVGDLFDFWFEYKYVIPKKHFTVINQLARMREKNIKIIYLAGNHSEFKLLTMSGPVRLMENGFFFFMVMVSQKRIMDIGF
jgi:DNA repair exonuclease SbcCD nuclease subunit